MLRRDPAALLLASVTRRLASNDVHNSVAAQLQACTMKRMAKGKEQSSQAALVVLSSNQHVLGLSATGVGTYINDKFREAVVPWQSLEQRKNSFSSDRIALPTVSTPQPTLHCWIRT